MENSDKKKEVGAAMKQFRDIVARLRDPETGCPWDRRQTLADMKGCCVDEAVEVLAGIDLYNDTGNADNLKEELGDLLLQIVLQAQIAEDEGLFSLSDVIQGISEKMIRRHPHVFHPGDPANGELEDLIAENQPLDEEGNLLTSWADIKALEKKGKVNTDSYLENAYEQMIDRIEEKRALKD